MVHSTRYRSSVDHDEPVLRLATLDDEAVLYALIKESTTALFPRFYDHAQAASAVRYVPEVDRMLLADGTYFVVEVGGEAVDAPRPAALPCVRLPIARGGRDHLARRRQTPVRFNGQADPTPAQNRSLKLHNKPSD